MNKLGFVLLALTIGIASSLPTSAGLEFVKNSNTITLTPENTVTFRGVVDAVSVGKVMGEIADKRKEYSGTIYLVMDSPGGSIYAGNVFIEYIKTVPKIKTISLFAASMAHGIVQATPGERLITSTGIMMAHRASGSFQGQFEEGEVESQLKLWKSIVRQLEKSNASRIGISLEEYKKKVVNEWWSYGSEAVEEHVADREVRVECSEELINSRYEETIVSFFGSYTIEYSECPVFKFPTKIK